MRLLHFVKQDNRIRLPPHRLGQLPAFLVAYVAGRRADEPGNRVAFLILRHIESDHVLLIIEEKLGQRFAQFCLTHTSRPQEDETPDWSVGILQSSPCTTHRVGNGLDRFVLTNDPQMEPLLHLQ